MPGPSTFSVRTFAASTPLTFHRAVSSGSEASPAVTALSLPSMPSAVASGRPPSSRAAARVAAADARVREVIHGAGSPVLYLDTPEFEKYVQDDARKMAEVVKRMGKIQ